PNIFEECLRWGIDITREPIPVVPAAHFMCGGITTNLEGRTSLPGLWAIGECACTGVHGANRLASNSLLEGLVFGHRAAQELARTLDRSRPWPEVPEGEIRRAVPSGEAVIITHNWDELRRLMWNYVGIVRSDTRLRRAARRIALLNEEISEYYWRYYVTRDLLELRNIATVAQPPVVAAPLRTAPLRDRGGALDGCALAPGAHLLRGDGGAPPGRDHRHRQRVGLRRARDVRHRIRDDARARTRRVGARDLGRPWPRADPALALRGGRSRPLPRALDGRRSH